MRVLVRAASGNVESIWHFETRVPQQNDLANDAGVLSVKTISKLAMHGRCWLSIVGLILLLTVVSNGASPSVPVSAILANPQQFDGKTVTIQGTAAAVKPTISRRNNPYTTLRVRDGGAEITVFTFGHPDIQNDDRVEVTGVFSQVKRVPPYTFYKEIEAFSVTRAQ
jgi:hypothetical protein